MEKIITFLKQFGVLLAVGGVGIIVLGYGLWGVLVPESASVEIVKGNPSRSDLLITVDIAGAVGKPGVYKLPDGSRIGDVLVLAGGLSASADREWVAKTVNLAELVKDGEKIYIPSRQVTDRETPSQSNGKGVTLESQNPKLININKASLEELDGLTGIGEVRAKTIMDNRPYGSSAELLSKAKIPQSVYDKIKDLVSVY